MPMHPDRVATTTTSEVETWDAKIFSAQDITDMIKEARQRFHEETHDHGNCTVCSATNVLVEQHWNDVGGPDTVQCEMCWVDGLIWFWMNEKASEVT